MITVVVVVAAFAATAVFRYLAITGFPNDHHVYLAGAQQILYGHWPTRDWVDPGMPLMFGASAVAQLMLGRTLFAEAVLVAVAYGAASSAIVIAGRRLSGSLVIGALAAFAAVMIFPRTYAYPKILLYAVAPLTWWWYLERPGAPRAALVAAWVAIAALFRHDHGAYLGAAGLLVMALAPAPGGGRETARRCATFVLLVALLMMPYAAYIEANLGMREYIAMGITFNAAEESRTRLVIPSFQPGGSIDANAEAWLFFLFHALPVSALAILAVRWWRNGRRAETAIVAGLVLVALAVNRGFLRDPLRARLADAVVPASLLAAWLAGHAVRIRPLAARAAPALVVIAAAGISAPAIGFVGETREQVRRTGVDTWIDDLPEYVRTRTTELRARYSDRQVPHPHVTPLVPFLEYLERCTVPSHHLLVAGFAPELFVYSQRPFAAGLTSFVPGYHEAPAAQQAMVARMARQVVPFTVGYSDAWADWRSSFGLLSEYVESRFAPMAEIPTTPDRSLRVLVNTELRPEGRDPQTSWPCFR